MLQTYGFENIQPLDCIPQVLYSGLLNCRDVDRAFTPKIVSGKKRCVHLLRCFIR